MRYTWDQSRGSRTPSDPNASTVWAGSFAEMSELSKLSKPAGMDVRSRASQKCSEKTLSAEMSTVESDDYSLD